MIDCAGLKPPNTGLNFSQKLSELFNEGGEMGNTDKSNTISSLMNI